MKKLFIFASALLVSAMAMGATAPKVTLNFWGPDNWGIGKTKLVTQQSFTCGGYTITMIPDATNGYKYNVSQGDTTLLFGKKGAALQLPAFNFAVGKIIVYGAANASGKTTMNIYVGDTAVSTECTSCKETHAYLIDKNHQTAGTIYKLVVTNANNAQISKIEIYEAVAGAPETPIMSVPSGIYNTPQSVQITCATDGATIQYSTDGATYIVYTTPISVTTSMTLSAKAVKAGIESEVANATYTFISTEGSGTKDDPYTVSDVQLWNNQNKDTVWVKGYILGCVDSKTGTLLDSIVASNLMIGVNKTDKTGSAVQLVSSSVPRAELNLVDHPENIGRWVKVRGTMESYCNTKGVKNVKDFELEQVAGAPETPEFSVPGGIITEAQVVVELSCATAGADIYYTMDGSVPSESATKYTEAITLTETTTIKAMAFKNQISSSMVQATYTFATLQGDGSKDNPYTVADLTALNNTGDSAWVGGYIIGCAKTTTGALVTDEGDMTDNNILIADEATAEKGAPVQLSKNDLQAALGVVSNPTNVGRYVKVYGLLTSYCTKNGVKNTSDYELDQLQAIENMDGQLRGTGKVLRDGRIVIIRNDEQFTITGQKIP